MLYLHVCPVVLDAVEDDFTDLTAEVKHWVQHARGCLTIVLLEQRKNVKTIFFHCEYGYNIIAQTALFVL